MPLQLYRTLSTDRRIAAVEWNLSDDPVFREEMIRRYLRKVGGFRPATVRAWPPRRFAGQIVRRELEDAVDAAALLKVHFVHLEPQIQTRFLQLTGVPSNGAEIPEELPRPYAGREKVVGAVAPLGVEFGLDALTYLQALAAVVPDAWEGIPEAIERFHDVRAERRPLAPADAAPAAEDSVDVPRPEPRSAPVRMRPPGPGQLAVLDDVVIVAIINAANGVDGCLRPEAAKRLVAELARVNGQRHQSWYVVGLYRSLFDDPDNDPGANDSPLAREWFLAGRIVGLVRRNKAAEVLALFDADAGCRALGQTGEGASGEAAPHLFTALFEAGRFGDAAGFLSPNAVAVSPRIGSRVLDAASALLSRRRPAEARALLDLVREGFRILEADGHRIDPQVLRQVQRRRGHCRRLLGEFDSARELIRPVAADEQAESEVRSMLATDLALMDAEYRELADLALPEDRGEAQRAARRLESVRVQLQDAVTLDPDGAAHALYVLGMLELLEERGSRALEHLDRAVAAFRARPDVYTRQGLLARAELHRALAVCLAGGTPETVVRAARMVMESTSEELRVPDWLIESLLISVGAADGSTAEELFNRLAESRGEELVASLEGLAGTIPAIAAAFLARASTGNLSAARRARAGRVALRAFLAQDNLDSADEVLGVIVDLARRGIERQETLTMLAGDDDLTRLRGVDELLWIRAELHAAAGEVGNAIALFRQVAEQQLSASAPWQRAEAEETIGRLSEFPEADEAIGQLRERLRRVEETLPAPEFSRGQREVRILIVGGNETQGRYEAEIRERLRRDAPHLTLEFYHTGWASNWGDTARQITDRLAQADGMVLHYFIRTMLGRKVRQAAPIWCSVAGHGRDGILRGIQRCAEMVEQKRGQQ